MSLLFHATKRIPIRHELFYTHFTLFYPRDQSYGNYVYCTMQHLSDFDRPTWTHVRCKWLLLLSKAHVTSGKSCMLAFGQYACTLSYGYRMATPLSFGQKFRAAVSTRNCPEWFETIECQYQTLNSSQYFTLKLGQKMKKI